MALNIWLKDPGWIRPRFSRQDAGPPWVPRTVAVASLSTFCLGYNTGIVAGCPGGHYGGRDTGSGRICFGTWAGEIRGFDSSLENNLHVLQGEHSGCILWSFHAVIPQATAFVSSSLATEFEITSFGSFQFAKNNAMLSHLLWCFASEISKSDGLEPTKEMSQTSIHKEEIYP